MKKFTYRLDQLRNLTERQIRARFMPFSWAVKEHGGAIMDDYFTADTGTIEAASELAACEKLFFIYNCRRPAGYTGASMSVSDVVTLWDKSKEPMAKTTWYCNTAGFVRLNDDGTEAPE